MKINGTEAINILNKIEPRVKLYKQDRTDKLRSFKIMAKTKNTVFAFDTKTTTGLFVWINREPPKMPGLTDIEDIKAKSKSTALDRVFEGCPIKARYKLTIENEDAFFDLISYFENLG